MTGNTIKVLLALVAVGGAGYLFYKVKPSDEVLEHKKEDTLNWLQKVEISKVAGTPNPALAKEKGQSIPANSEIFEPAVLDWSTGKKVTANQVTALSY